MSKSDRSALGEKEVDALFAKLIDDDDDVAYEAGRTIRKLGWAIFLRTLDLTRDSNPRAREMACFILGQLSVVEEQDPLHPTFVTESVPILVDLLRNDPAEQVRAGAAAALGHQAIPLTLPDLVK